MPYKYAVLYELDDDAQPVGIVLERDGYVMLELPNEEGWPKRYDGEFRVIGPDYLPVTYRPGRPGYFEQVILELSRMFAVGVRDEVEHANDGVAASLLAAHVLEPRTRRRRSDYGSGLCSIPARQPLVLGRLGQVTPTYVRTRPRPVPAVPQGERTPPLIPVA